MIHYKEALEIIREGALSLGASKKSEIEKVEILLIESAGRVCAENHVSHLMSPAFPQSTMDGFAVRSEWTTLASGASPVALAVGGCVAAGDPYLKRNSKTERNRETAEIMTGAPIPEDYDAVIKVEDVVCRRDEKGKVTAIEIKAPAKVGQFYRKPGEDLKPGTLILSAGDAINSEKILAAAAAGITKVSVYRKLRVGVIATGKEIAPLNEAPGPHQVVNSTAPYLLSAATRAGCEVRYVGLCGDDPGEFDELFKRALNENFDIVITTGAVSMGKHDYIPSSVSAHGIDLHFEKVAIKPGKPIIFGIGKSGVAYFGLPGNPVSSAVTFRFFVEPFMRARLGLKPEVPMSVPLSKKIEKPTGLTCFYKAGLSEGRWSIDVLQDQASHLTRALVDATGWAVLPHTHDSWEAGSQLEFFPFH